MLKSFAVNTAIPGGLALFRSSSADYGEWTSFLRDLSALEYRATDADAGLLSVLLADESRSSRIGTVSKRCWDELSNYVRGLVRTSEAAGE